MRSKTAGNVFILFFCLIALFCHLSVSVASQGNTDKAPLVSKVPSKRILILYSYGYSLPAQQEIAAGINSVISSKKLNPENIFHEYLDIAPPRSPDQKRILTTLLLNKYAGQKFDLIITVFDTALDFIMNEGLNISSDSPVLAFIARERASIERGGKKISYIRTQYDLRGTLELALKLFPKTSRVIFMAGNTKNNMELEKQAQAEFAPWRGKLDFEYTSNLSAEDMRQKVQRLPRDSIVIFSIITSDITGRIFIPRDLLVMFARESNAPFFGIASTHLRSGIVGGSVFNMEAAGAMLGRTGIDVINGETQIYEPTSNFIKPMLDWKQIERWGGDVSRLPKDCIIINQPVTLWGQYKGFVLGSIVVILLLSSLTIALILQNRRRIFAEKELRDSELHFRTLFDASGEAILIHELPSCAIIDINKTGCDMFGYSRQEIFQLKVGDLCSGIVPYIQSEIIRHIETAASGTPQLLEWQMKDKSGRIFWIEARNKAVRLGNDDRVIATIRDISERKRLEEQLLQSQKMESIGRLAGGVAHDFNNMLTVILGYAELSKRALPEDNIIRQNLHGICKAAERSRDITRQLLVFSRKEIIAPKPVDLNKHIIDSLNNLGRLIGEDIKLSFHPSADLWVVMIDPSQVEQILMNLSGNAMDAMPAGGNLLIETVNISISDYCHKNFAAEPGDYVQLTISDTGHGMDRETLEHIFEPFFTTKGVGKGTGLGLATVYGIVTQNKGFINVYSEPEHGTAFKIYFPRVMDVPALVQISEVPAYSDSGTILLVEDEESVRHMTADMLEFMGYSVLQAETPLTALSICENMEQEIDLLLTDVIMPDMSGKEVYERIEMIRPGIKALFMSGYTADIIMRKSVLEEHMHFIQKPFDMDVLNAKIKSALG